MGVKDFFLLPFPALHGLFHHIIEPRSTRLVDLRSVHLPETRTGASGSWMESKSTSAQ